ncbi:MAG: DNA mismatch repair endonuclease MutL [Nitrospirae bacterium]|nr:DNA mismatch repair endonuclease MutL [Nitrospirota bacterium]
MMISKIKILPDYLITRIAAGEVVERPASVVKELVDNAIDARSTEIIIRLMDGGKKLIAVSDNGEGMAPQDALIAFERHATSKLSSETDLEHILTLGFRGEALPSISGVSRVHLTTKSREGSGIELKLEEGKVTHQKEIGRGTGTQIAISALFDNFPARKKFLRSASTELAAITATVNQLALAHSHIGFELFHQDKKVFAYPAVENLRNRVYQIYGSGLLDQLTPLEKEDDPLFGIEGFISLPPHSQGTRSYQELFINGRPIKNPLISHAIYEAYSTHLMKGQHPVFIFLLGIDPSRVDVNVHPSKKEVRFSDSSMVHQKIYRKVKETLGRSSPSGQTAGPAEGEEPGIQPGGKIEVQYRVREAIQQYLNSGQQEERRGRTDPPDFFKDARGEKEPFYQVLGQFHSMFLLVQAGEELQIIDQHAAHERVLFERFLGQYSRETIPVQPLLIPQQLDFTADEMVVLQEYEKDFHELGFEFDFFGERTIRVRSVPGFLSRAELASLFADLVEEVRLFGEVFSKKEKLEKIVATLACHAAVKAGQSMGPNEISVLYGDLLRLNIPLTCPHGRPITKRLSLKEMERMFCRI